MAFHSNTTTTVNINNMVADSKARTIHLGRLGEKDVHEVRLAETQDGIVTNKMMKRKGLQNYGGQMECHCGMVIIATTQKQMALKIRLHNKFCPAKK